MAIRRFGATVGAVVFMLNALAGSVLAADPATEARWSAACRGDAFKHCTLQALSVDRAGVRDCLIRRIDKISEACRNVIRAAQAQGVELSAAPSSNPPPSNSTTSSR
jgi:hypothetical protein